jgi:hypothetical protein
LDLDDDPNELSQKLGSGLIDQEYMRNCRELSSNCALEEVKHHRYLVVTLSASLFVSSGPSQELMRVPSSAVPVGFLRKWPLTLSSHWNSDSGGLVP